MMTNIFIMVIYKIPNIFRVVGTDKRLKGHCKTSQGLLSSLAILLGLSVIFLIGHIKGWRLHSSSFFIHFHLHFSLSSSF
ncbi:hypothetical protein HanIR_Chr12g0603061 [Helianthus annuus]|nr:hypothetical protein HanIR_Chr12g0603061 [Helianthus annuus]